MIPLISSGGSDIKAGVRLWTGLVNPNVGERAFGFPLVGGQMMGVRPRPNTDSFRSSMGMSRPDRRFQSRWSGMAT